MELDLWNSLGIGDVVEISSCKWTIHKIIDNHEFKMKNANVYSSGEGMGNCILYNYTCFELISRKPPIPEPKIYPETLNRLDLITD